MAVDNAIPWHCSSTDMAVLGISQHNIIYTKIHSLHKFVALFGVDGSASTNTDLVADAYVCIFSCCLHCSIGVLLDNDFSIFG